MGDWILKVVVAWGRMGEGLGGRRRLMRWCLGSRRALEIRDGFVLSVPQNLIDYLRATGLGGLCHGMICVY